LQFGQEPNWLIEMEIKTWQLFGWDLN